MFDLGRFSDRIIHTADIPARDARFAPIPDGLHPGLRDALHSIDINQLYIHQAQMVRRALAGESCVITTGTASGKSLSFLLPVLDTIIREPSARAFLLYPTKALAQDQLRALLKLADELQASVGRPIDAGVYDGDTPPAARRRIRERANLVMTNPDMLNAGLLPAHGRQGYAHIFRNVRWIVIDEMHVYRGAMGAHFSNLLRRLLRVCRHYGSEPRFLCSSATIANPRELAEKLCHQPFTLIDDDGSPSAGKRVHFWLPPRIEDTSPQQPTRSGSDARRGIGAEMAAFVPHLIRQRCKTIAFCRSRKETEIVLRESRDRLRRTDRDHDESALLAAYRGGYTPAERRKVEQDLLRGRLMGVVSTNALELGIDIGALEVVVQGGFPGTRASFWQQIGRAGRRGTLAHAVVMLAMSPIDQYIGSHPEWLVDQKAETAVVDPDNLTVQMCHVRCAAAELPLTLDDVATWPDLAEIIAVLQDAGELRERDGAWHWSGGAFPAGDFSLRGGDPDRFKVVNKLDGTTLTEMTRPQVYREAHTRAIYLHDGREYLVEELDLVSHLVTVVPADVDYYTQPDVRANIDVLVLQERTDFGRTRAFFGDVRVDESVVGYKMLQFHNHQNLGYEKLHQELSMRLETEGVWWVVPDNVLQALGGEERDAVRGMVHALRAVARLRTMAERSDLRGTSFKFVDGTARQGELPGHGRTRTAVICYDSHPGGIGFASKGFDFAERLANDAIELLSECPCSDGCPACVGEFTVSKRAILWALRNLFEQSSPPAGLKVARPLPRPRTGPRVPWADVQQQWARVQRRLLQDRHPGAALLASIATVKVRSDKLVLGIGSAALGDWIASEAARQQLREAIERVVETPSPWRLTAELDEERTGRSSRARHKLRRRLEDMKADDATSEKHANRKLASGFTLPGDGTIN